MLFVVALAALGGLLLGSFLNVVIARLPAGESVVAGRSHCPACGATIAARDNIPVLSYLVLRGRCRHCGGAISPRYLVVELVTGGLFAATVAVHREDTPELVLGLVLIAFLVPISAIDLELRKIPNKLTLPAAVLALILGTMLDPGGEPERLIAGAAAAAFLGIPSLISPKGMGMGDAKLAGVMGLYLGAAVAPALLIGLFAGVVVGMTIVARVGMTAGRRTRIPFGPYLALGGVVAVLAGNELLSLYVDSF